MAAYYLGVDVGASKSQAAIADRAGRILALVRGDGANPDSVGCDGLASTLGKIIDEALEIAQIARGEISGTGYGIAGYDWPSQRAALAAAVESLGLSAPYEIVNDALLAVAAGSSTGWGIGVVAGTSCNAWGWDRNRRVGRMTGYAWLGEAAGGQELIEKAQQAVAKEWTRRGPETRLTQVFREKFGAPSVDDLIEGITLERYNLQPADAPLVFRAAAEGDQVALDLVLWAGRELGDLAVGVIRQLGLEEERFEVILAGNFWKGSPLLIREFEAVVGRLAPGAMIARLNGPPVIGGVCIGMEVAGMAESQIEEARHQLNEGI
ncbi:MAG: hypothetical protein JXJ17_00005 [Anaerolineae bacterium]|nr:hypothetical protein [Anaerolineae bacterium]